MNIVTNVAELVLPSIVIVHSTATVASLNKAVGRGPFRPKNPAQPQRNYRSRRSGKLPCPHFQVAVLRRPICR
jgi:hypothetical protein